MKNLLKLVTFIIICLGILPFCYAQTPIADNNAVKAVQIKRLITSQNFVFKPEYAVNVTPEEKLFNDFGLAVSKDILEIYLPGYYTTTSHNPGGWNVDVVKFDYYSSVDKKGIWHVFITTKDLQWENVKFTLTLKPDGSGTLAYAGRIYFTGHIEPISDSLASN